MTWRVEFLPASAKEFAALDGAVQKRIGKFLSERLALLDDPRSLGEALRGPKLGAFWKYRVGDWRVIASIEDQTVRIMIVRIGNRRAVYR